MGDQRSRFNTDAPCLRQKMLLAAKPTAVAEKAAEQYMAILSGHMRSVRRSKSIHARFEAEKGDGRMRLRVNLVNPAQPRLWGSSKLRGLIF